MKVTFNRYSPETKKYDIVGILALADNTLQWVKEPDIVTKGLAETPIFDIESGSLEAIKPQADPVKYMRNLPLNYSGTYFRAELVDDGGMNKAMDFPKPDTRSMPGELENQQSPIVKVNGVKEIQSRTPQMNNSEPYYEKSIINDWFYKLSPNEGVNTSLANLKLDLVSKGVYDEVKFKQIAQIVRKSKSLFHLKQELDLWTRTN